MKPLNNNCLIEVLREYAGVSRSDENEALNYGILIDYNIQPYHLTASAAERLDDKFILDTAQHLGNLVDKRAVVRWEQFAEAGQTVLKDGKTYAIVPWWRLIASEEPSK